MMNNYPKRAPLLSLITVNYNGVNDTLQLLESIYSNICSVPFEVIVVDNCSADETEISIIAEHYPLAKTIRTLQNLGFAGGNNIGIEASSGKYIFLINNDTLIPEDHFEALLQKMENDPAIGAVSPKIVFQTPAQTIQFAGYTPLSSITLRNSLIGFLHPDSPQFDIPIPTPYCHGAAMIVKREVIEKVGKMPEIYFLYYEELDWSISIARKGYRLQYEPIQKIIHKESATVGRDSSTKAYYFARNRLLFAYRNLVSTQMLLSILYQLLISIPKRVLVYLLKGNFKNVKATVAGGLDFFKIKNKKL